MLNPMTHQPIDHWQLTQWPTDPPTTDPLTHRHSKYRPNQYEFISRLDDWKVFVLRTLMRARIASFYKSLLNSAYYRSRVRLAAKKNRNISCYQITKLLKMWFLLLVSTNRQTRYKTDFVTKFVGIIVTIFFI